MKSSHWKYVLWIAVVEIRNFCERNICKGTHFIGSVSLKRRMEILLLSFTSLRRSHRRYSIKKVFLKISQYQKKNHLHWSFFLACSFIKTRLHNSCFPVNFEKLLSSSFSQNTSGRLLLKPLYGLGLVLKNIRSLLPALFIFELPLVKSLIFWKDGFPSFFSTFSTYFVPG